MTIADLMADHPPRPSPSGPEAPAISRLHVAGAAVGNALEFYDFTTYVFFATQIGHAFFPSRSPLGSLLLSLATFGAGFCTRPLGAIVIGAYGDRVGRRPAMLLSFFLMGLAIVGLALCPSYAAIGPAAPILVVLIRLVQGFALGGEIGPTTAFLLEAAPARRRGLYTAMQSVSQNLASLAAGLIGFVVSGILTGAQLESFGWRMVLLIGALVLPFGLWIRRSLPETLHLPEAHPLDTPAAPALSRSDGLRVALCSIAILVGGTVATYTQSYLTTYSSTILHMKVSIAFGATIVYGVCGIVFNLIGAMLSDRVGRRPVMIWPRVGLALIIFPAFWLLDRNRDGGTLAIITGVMTALASFSGGALMASITESLPKSQRSTALAIIYASTIAVVGGTTQFTITWLISVTGDLMCPAYYYIGATALSLAGMFSIRESAPAQAMAARLRVAPA